MRLSNAKNRKETVTEPQKGRIALSVPPTHHKNTRRGGERKEQKHIQRNNGWKLPKFDEEHSRIYTFKKLNYLQVGQIHTQNHQKVGSQREIVEISKRKTPCPIVGQLTFLQKQQRPDCWKKNEEKKYVLIGEEKIQNVWEKSLKAIRILRQTEKNGELPQQSNAERKYKEK